MRDVWVQSPPCFSKHILPLHRSWCLSLSECRVQTVLYRPTASSEKTALRLWLFDWRWAEDSTDGFVEHRLKATLSKGGAFQIFHGACTQVQKETRIKTFLTVTPSIAHWLLQRWRRHIRKNKKRWETHTLNILHRMQTVQLRTQNLVWSCKPNRLWTLLLTDFFSHSKALWVSNGSEFLFFQLFNSVLVVSQVDLGSNQNDWGVGAVMPDLRIPLWEKETAHFRYRNNE